MSNVTMGLPNCIVLPSRFKVENAPKKAPARRNSRLEIPTSSFGPPKGAFPRIWDNKKPMPKTSEPFPRATKLREPPDKKLLAKKYATISALTDRNKECADENGDGSSKTKLR